MMITHIFTVIVLAILIVLGIGEWLMHRKRLLCIPIRIHVNGSRGKTSVTRLTAAALREAGFRVIARTTGAEPRHILVDGTEEIIVRRGQARISEYIDTVKTAASNNADAVILECMAINPEYQRIAEKMLVKSTHGVITNIRDDHLDVMGPGLENVAEALSNTIPKKGHLITAEKRYLPLLCLKASQRLTEVVPQNTCSIVYSNQEIADLYEFNENIRIVLALCSDLGIPVSTAIKGMKKAVPDPGSLICYLLPARISTLHAVDAFSVNDPTSTSIVFDKLAQKDLLSGICVIIYNHRVDRSLRALAFIPFLVKCHELYNIERFVLTGADTYPLFRRLLKAGIPKNRIVRYRKIHDGEVFMAELTRDLREDAALKGNTASITMIGLGNLSGEARKLTEYWKSIGDSHV